jgi:hypothetical protein
MVQSISFSSNLTKHSTERRLLPKAGQGHREATRFSRGGRFPGIG